MTKQVELPGFLVGEKQIVEFERKKENLRKVNCCYRENGNLVDSEGFWAWLSDEDIKSYDSDAASGYAVAVASNYTFNGIPWGAYFPVEFRGKDLPVCIINEMIDTESKIVYHSVCFEEIEKSKQESEG